MMGRLQEGYDCFTKAINEDIFDARSWHNRANCAFKLGNLKQAHYDSTKARRASAEIPDPSNPSFGAPVPPPRSSLAGSRPHTGRASTAGRSSRPGTGVSFASAAIEDEPLSPDTLALWDKAGQPGVQEDPNERLKAQGLPKETNEQKRGRKAANEEANENLRLLTVLLQHGANARYTQRGLTCLGRAAVVGNAEVAQFLLMHGAELEGAAHQRRYKTCGFTPLMLAAQHGHVNVMRILLAAGTDLDASTAAVVKGVEETVWFVAEKYGTAEVKATLIEVVGEDGVRSSSSSLKPTPPLSPRPPDSSGGGTSQLSAKERRKHTRTPPLFVIALLLLLLLYLSSQHHYWCTSTHTWCCPPWLLLFLLPAVPDLTMVTSSITPHGIGTNPRYYTTLH